MLCTVVDRSQLCNLLHSCGPWTLGTVAYLTEGYASRREVGLGLAQVSPSAITAGGRERVRNVIEEDIFRLILELEGHKAVRLQYCLSVIVLSAEANGQEATEAAVLTRHVAEVAARQVRATDV